MLNGAGIFFFFNGNLKAPGSFDRAVRGQDLARAEDMRGN